MGDTQIVIFGFSRIGPKRRTKRQRHDDTARKWATNLATVNLRMWEAVTHLAGDSPLDSAVDEKGINCTHAGSAPCHFHGRHIS